MKLKQMMEDPLVTLADIAREFGCTRQHYANLFKEFYGFSYSKCRNRENEVRYRTGKVIDHYKKIADILDKKKIKYKIKNHRFIINDNICSVRNTSKIYPRKDEFFFYAANRIIREGVDFFLLDCHEDGVYVIPSIVMPYGISIVPGCERSKYYKYKNNFVLLKRRKYGNLF